MRTHRSSLFPITVLTVVALLIAAVNIAAEDRVEPDWYGLRTAENVILLIGDGMGMNHIHLAELYAEAGLSESTAMTTLPEVAATLTENVEDNVTDSAAAGSSIHSGGHFENGFINIGPDGQRYYTIGHAAQEAGKSVGVVATARITHATPASVYAAVESRGEENTIAEQLLEFAPEVALGGGHRHFIPQSEEDSSREDDRNLVEEMVEQGYTYVATGSELAAVDSDETEHLFGLFTSSHLSYEVDRVNEELDEPSLAEMTDVSLEILDDNEEGFFLMVEGARIDHASHAHDAVANLHDTLAFDEAVRVALEFNWIILTRW